MATINTVNFEDLFDFSPEPLEVHDQQQEQQEQQFFGGTETPSSPSLSPPRLETTSALSQSVPTNWGLGIEQHFTTAANTNENQTSDFNTSVDQLLATLPESTVAASESLSPHSRARSGGSFGSATSSSLTPGSTKGKRGRKPGQRSSLKTDMKSKLERSRQSARECRARKKLRYQYLDDLILEREKANLVLLDELIRYQEYCHEMDKGRVPDGLREVLNQAAVVSSA